LVITIKNMILPYNPNNKEPSRKLRRKMTPAERCLWQRLRRKHLGFIFHYQKPAGNYIADFYCPEAMLVVEVDGDYHDCAETRGNDKVRDEEMHNLHLIVLRFKNEEVLNETDKVVKTIDDVLLSLT
jgi:very-short-patch-repair endonuclease